MEWPQTLSPGDLAAWNPKLALRGNWAFYGQFGTTGPTTLNVSLPSSVRIRHDFVASFNVLDGAGNVVSAAGGLIKQKFVPAITVRPGFGSRSTSVL